MPDILALVGDAYTQLHDLPKAEEAYRAVVALAGKPSGPSDGLHEFAGASGGHGHTLDRQYAMFCADHDRDLDGAYACALRELTARRDVYAFDALAWVCFKRGEVQEAKLAMDRALAQGTQDAQLYYHAGKIYEAAHEPTTASHFLSQALALNALLNPAQIREARSELGLVAINRG
jgi:tetratricopeptide (TPR) repeat protein